MIETERKRGERLANLTVVEKKELVAKLMFGQQYQEARLALLQLMDAWGIGTPGDHEEKRVINHE